MWVKNASAKFRCIVDENVIIQCVAIKTAVTFLEKLPKSTIFAIIKPY
jgi:hypothetical protein